MRNLVIINQPNLSHTPMHPSIQIPPEFESIPFSNAKSLLGNEYPFAVYDMRAENGVNLNLEALAIVAGTIRENGTLYLICPNWEKLENEIDFDSQRWNDGKAVATPKFWAFFKALVKKFRFEITPLFSKEGLGEIWQKALTENTNSLSQEKLSDKSRSHFGKFGCQISPNPSLLKRGTVLTEEQIHIFNNLPHCFESVHLITAPRGRGKSTLSGKLAETVSQEQSVIITARAKAALPSFWRQIESEKVRFSAPDALIQAVNSGENFATSWLFIDEAASLPLPMLQTLCQAFGKVVMTTTTQNYEGTGRGFALKLPKMLKKSVRHWQLNRPLRWGANDALECFIHDLLLLSDEQTPLFSKEGQGEIWQTSLTEKINPSSKEYRYQISPNPSFLKRGMGIEEKIDFYTLLSSAHYKTTPSDLRRLFDGENQRLFDIYEDGRLIAGAWGMFEGGLESELTQAIWRGERRPKGNLVAQYLCFQGNLPEACKLRSLRLSRIAVQPDLQGRGYGKRLIGQIILQISGENPPLDFLSVSFGMSDELLRFWQQCGFRLVQISQQPEASSGLHSAMMIYPLSEQGKTFAEFAENRFARDERLQKNGENQPLDAWDWQNLQGFAEAQRTFSACFTSLQRLYLQRQDEMHVFSALFSQNKSVKNSPNREMLKMLRNFVQNLCFF